MVNVKPRCKCHSRMLYNYLVDFCLKGLLYLQFIEQLLIGRESHGSKRNNPLGQAILVVKKEFEVASQPLVP